jgi:crotonobetainyl-CoA:carnitine CoA-transferase CaiB-like acyl-CoA transferase
MFARLHEGHESVTLDFRSSTDRRELFALVDAADVVLESSRPRALRQLGVVAEEFLEARRGRVWVSITGYGRAEDRAQRVAFGDDAAVGGGLVAWSDDGSPLFCGDAIADPVAGLYATVGALGSLSIGGGHLIDVSMCASANFVNNGASCLAEHTVDNDGDGWSVRHNTRCLRVARPRQPKMKEYAPMTVTSVAKVLSGRRHLASP